MVSHHDQARGFAVHAAVFLLLGGGPAVHAEEQRPPPCRDDAMIVFDASGAMAGNVNQGVATIIPRIDEVRASFAKVLPGAAQFRRVGLITFGPGPYNQCNVQLNFAPVSHAADRIMEAVNALTPAGKTPLTSAVEQAAEVLDYRNKPGVIVVVTDGEETCGRSPCNLGRQLHDAAFQLTIHVIGYRVENYSWTGEQSIGEAKCLAESNGGLYAPAKSQEDLVAALEKTLDCPMTSQLRRQLASLTN